MNATSNSTMPLGNTMNISVILVSSVKALGSFWLLLIVGFICGKYKLLTPSCLDALSQLSFYLFAPLFLFQVMASSLTLATLSKCYILMFWCCFHFAVAFIIGYILQFFLKDKNQKLGSMFVSEFIVSCVTHNCGTMPTVLMDQLCRQGIFKDAVTGLPMEYTPCFSVSVMYLFIYGVPWNFAFFGVGWNAVSALNDKDEDKGIKKNQTYFSSFLLTMKKSILNPPMIGLILGVIVGVSPPLSALFVGNQAPLYPVTSIITMIGSANIPCSGLILSGNLYVTAVSGVEAVLKLLKPALKIISSSSFTRRTRGKTDDHVDKHEKEMLNVVAKGQLDVKRVEEEKKEKIRMDDTLKNEEENIIKDKIKNNKDIELQEVKHVVEDSDQKDLQTNATTINTIKKERKSCCRTDTVISFVILLVRLVLCPAFSFVVIYFGKVQGDVLFLFLLLILGGFPTAMSVPMMFQQLGRTESIRPLAWSLIYQHTLSLISLTILVAISLYYATSLQS